jgi:hypothetical protein
VLGGVLAHLGPAHALPPAPPAPRARTAGPP